MYKTKLSLVEPTKLLERITVDNLRFINPLGHDYVSGAYNISPVGGIGENINFAEYSGGPSSDPPRTTIKDEVYKNVVPMSGVNIYNLSFWLLALGVWTPKPAEISLIAPDGTTVWTGTAYFTTGSQIASVRVNASGNYTVKYSTQDGNKTITATYSIYVVNNTTAKPPYTITTAIERVLNAGVGAYNGYFKLDPALAEKWKNIEAPEFEITGKTLFEALLLIGGYKDVQAIPRLTPTPGSAEDWEYNFIKFDLLNGDEEWTPPRGYIDKQEYWDGESYCGGVESYVDNFVDNTKNGAIKPSFPMTVRTETSDLIIDDGHAIIKTEFPIYKIEKVEQAYISATGEPVGDITPYIFEKSEYDKLSSYVGTFPTAKQFALYYIQGQPNLYGLVLKPETATAIGAAIQDFAAVQIAEKKSGQKYTPTLGIRAFAYKVTYTPITNRRIRQFRPTRDFPNGNLLYYNQSGNIVDSKNYGGRMKGELARIGNKVELETYRLYNLADMPKPGMKKDGKYISQVDWEIQATCMKVTIHLVKNYNRLSQYIGINSMQRFYEVSEKQATYRPLNFSYFSQIGRLIGNANAKNIITADGISYFAETFKNIYPAGQIKISYVVVTAYSKDGVQIQSPTIHEVCGNGIGNSMSFYFSFEDNYSAGGQALFKDFAKNVQRAVPYSDEYGELYELQMDFYSGYATRELKFFDQASTDTHASFCDLLPEVSGAPTNYPPLISYRAVVDKNGGEKISVETQIHFQANSANIIIGSALGEDNLLVSNEAHTHTFVCLPYEIEALQERIPVEDVNTWKISTPGVDVVTSGGQSVAVAIGTALKPIRNTTSRDALSWACVNEQGNILIARNVKIAKDAANRDQNYINFNLTID